MQLYGYPSTTALVVLKNSVITYERLQHDTAEKVHCKALLLICSNGKRYLQNEDHGVTTACGLCAVDRSKTDIYTCNGFSKHYYWAAKGGLGRGYLETHTEFTGASPSDACKASAISVKPGLRSFPLLCQKVRRINRILDVER